MSEKTNVKIVSCTLEGQRIVSCAARISTTPGSAADLYTAATDSEKNNNLIQKVIRSGHRSILEHATVNLALSNVSVVVEQFFIEFRLASFTVKSRRYVDFRNMGYYVPDMPQALKASYCAHMDFLFDTYTKLVDLNIPKEDARFVLPYCLFSNFYCSANLRELLHILYEAKYGRGRHLAELQAIADSIIEALAPYFPTVIQDFCSKAPKVSTHEDPILLPTSSEPASVTPHASLLYATTDSETLFMQAAQIVTGSAVSEKEFDYDLFHRYPRLLEQYSASFRTNDISLASLTHLTRHRMQSLIVPDLRHTLVDHYVLPQSVIENPNAKELYQKAFVSQHHIIAQFRRSGIRDEVYLCMSGNTINVMTTMNARELLLFFKLRCCTRAQWEIRALANEMLCSLREREPKLFVGMGPSCVSEGICPEGKFSCGKIEEMRQQYLNETNTKVKE